MFSDELLTWYDKHQRHFPWRAKPGIKPNPYHVWLSEVMLQQTQTGTAVAYFNTFIQKWSTVHDLANSHLDEVLHAWAGLGYYSRARSLHKAAQVISQVFPKNEQQWLQIPGVGPYTAGAISAIAYDLQACPVDGNIARVFSRLFQIKEIKPRLYDIVKDYLQGSIPKTRNGDFIQALMDIGATVCMPKIARCEVCPLRSHCLGYKHNTAELFPTKQEKPIKPQKYAKVFWIENAQGQVFLQKRPEKGLLGGMMEFPSTPWITEITEHYIEGQDLNLTVKHTFTHFHLTLNIVKIISDKTDGIWSSPSDLKNYALPTLMKKVANAVLKQKTTLN